MNKYDKITFYNRGKVIVHEHHASSFPGNFRSTLAHGDADIGLRDTEFFLADIQGAQTSR